MPLEKFIVAAPPLPVSFFAMPDACFCARPPPPRDFFPVPSRFLLLGQPVPCPVSCCNDPRKFLCAARSSDTLPQSQSGSARGQLSSIGFGLPNSDLAGAPRSARQLVPVQLRAAQPGGKSARATFKFSSPCSGDAQKTSRWAASAHCWESMFAFAANKRGAPRLSDFRMHSVCTLVCTRFAHLSHTCFRPC